MYIKAIYITGFRSYRERTAIEDLSRRFNVVVGQNGSGKSNFFAAIQFVLSEDFAHLTAEERSNLLHEGTGNRSAVACVELLFDNSDRRLAAIESNEFVISRQVSAKKDTYFIDSRMSTRSEISSLMESAGFSRSNPYYIVKQGKIAELATATDLNRLKLLREVAGTRIYDEKKKESLDLLEETETKIVKSKLLLDYMDQRLATLEEEKEELKEYQKQDKFRRALEYSLANSEARDSKKEFDNCLDKRQKLQIELNDAENNKFEKSKEITSVELEIRTLETREKSLVEEIATGRAQEAQLSESRTASVLKTNDLKEIVDRIQNGKTTSEHQLEDLQRIISDKERELDDLKPRYTILLEKESQLKGDLNIATMKLNSLYVSTDNQFNSAEERDQHLRRKIMDTEHHINDNRDHEKKMKAAFEDERKTMVDTDERIEEIQLLLQQHVNDIDNMTEQDDQNRSELSKVTYMLHQKAAERKKISDQLNEKDNQFDHLNSSFYQSLPKAVAEGIRSIDRIMTDLKSRNTDGRYDKYIKGYHGIVIKHMKADPAYFKALEATAGSNLTFHIVDTDEIAMYLLDKINSLQYKGVTNFFPLNRLYAPEIRALRDTAKGRHLLSLIEFPEKFEIVFRHIFGGTILVTKIADGRAIAKNEQFDCITLDGDQVSHSGPMSGGYVDSRKSRLDTMMKITVFESEISALRDAYGKLSAEYLEAEVKAEKIRIELSKNDQARESIQRTHDQISKEKRGLTDLRNRIALNIEKGNETMLALNRKHREMVAHMDEMKSQLGTPLSDSQVKEEILAANEDLKDCRKNLDELSKELNVVAIKKAKIESELNACLYRKREDYLQRTGAIDLEVKKNEYHNSNIEAQKLKKAVLECQNQNEILQNEVTEVRQNILQLRVTLESLIDERNEADQIISQNTGDIENFRRKMADLSKKRDEALSRMKDLGTLPVNLIGDLAGYRKNQLEEKWMESVRIMKKYNNVNRKALDQFVRSAAERDELKSQIEELEKNHEHINRLLETTETRKFDVLYLTFKQVAKNFHDVFKKLVPTGVGDLVMKTAPLDPNDPHAVEKSQKQHVMERFIGVGIRVNFNDDSADGCREAFSLSGGQKTLVALALIFAIQKCDPAPFYLFDEIDAALDREKRAAVAALIGEFSSSAQFISTTFRPEMLHRADRCYGVRFRNKISYIALTDSGDAFEFLSRDEDEPEDEPSEATNAMEID